MNNVVIYKQNNIPVVLFPTTESLQLMSIQEFACKYVPNKTPFKIVNFSELSSLIDIPQEVWVIDDSEFNDGFGQREW